MKPPSLLVLVVLAALLSQISACSYRLVPLPSPGMPDKVRVTTKSGEIVDLARVETDSLTIRGDSRSGRQRVEIPLSEVERIETQRMDLWKTLGISGLLGLIAVSVFLLTGINAAPGG